MSLSRKQVSILCIIIAVVILAVTLGCVFGIKCTVTLNFGRIVRIEYGNIAVNTKDIKTNRFNSYYPPTNVFDKEHHEKLIGWYKDYSCTVPWLSTDKITSNITLYAKWEKD